MRSARDRKRTRGASRNEPEMRTEANPRREPDAVDFKTFLNIFQNIFKYANTVHNYNTRYAANQNLYKSKVRTNIGKQRISFVAIDLWKDLPSDLKDLNVFLFSKNLKRYLLSEQHK